MSLTQSYPATGILRRVAAAVAVAALVSFSSCKTPEKMIYMEDLNEEQVLQMPEAQPVKIEPNDKLAIVVSSQNPELTAPFNLPLTTTVAGVPGAGNYNMQVMTYTVSEQGNIDFPYLGEIHAMGLTRQQLATKIKDELIKRQLLADPVVTVEFTNLFYSISGEVNAAGRFPLDREGFTILDALARSGDMTLYGQRTNVKVLRREGGKQTLYVLDLTKGNDLTNSPAFYLKQNDIIYVTPSDMRLRQSTVNGNNALSISFWVSMASVLASIAVLIFK